jgi:transposase
MADDERQYFIVLYQVFKNGAGGRHTILAEVLQSSISTPGIRFLDDGRIELDTNIVERSIRPLVLNRKNALFAGHDQGAENWACIASLIETCKLHGVEPQAYLTDVLTKLVNLWPVSRIDELMPWAWAADRSANRQAA